jgi:hypothetical protein
MTDETTTKGTLSRAATEKKTLSASFNNLVGKVVSFQEYRTRENASMRQNLTVGERAFQLLIDNPHQLVRAIKELDYILNNQAKVYKDTANSSVDYVDAEQIASIEEGWSSRGMNKTFQEKALGLRINALEECSDYSDRIRSGQIRPLSLQH